MTTYFHCRAGTGGFHGLLLPNCGGVALPRGGSIGRSGELIELGGGATVERVHPDCQIPATRLSAITAM